MNQNFITEKTATDEDSENNQPLKIKVKKIPQVDKNSCEIVDTLYFES